MVRLCIAGVALSLNDLSSSLMTASAGDDNSTKELKGFVSYFTMCIELLCTASLQCRGILGTGIFVLGRHLGFSNCGGLGQGDIH